MKTSCYVLGAAYSGSTLFSSIMDTQPRVRGISEAIRHIRPARNNNDPWCSTCQGHISDCKQRPQVTGTNIHAAFFEKYDDTDVLIDTSKTWMHCFEYQHTDAEIKIISLAKWPHAFAWSQHNHSQRFEHPKDVITCFRTWLQSYSSAKKLYDMSTTWSTRRYKRFHEQPLYPQLDVSSFYEITYHDLVRETAKTVKGVCDFLGVEFDEAAIANWWKPTSTCAVGGNQSVCAQKHNVDFFNASEQSAAYLNGKYVGKRGEIFLDTTWLDNEKFMEEALAAYRELRDKIRVLTPLFGLGTFSDCVKALRNP
jgi:hypothetical protein